MIRRRLRVLLGLLALGFLVVLGRLFSMQVVSAEEYEVEAFRRLQRIIYLPPRRGTILDRDGRPLAINEPGYDLMVIPAEVKEESVRRIAALLDLSSQELADCFQEVEGAIRKEVARERARHEKDSGRSASPRLVQKIERHFRKESWLLLPDLLDEAKLLEIYVFPDRYPGFTVRGRAIRRYPAGDAACHLLGHMSKIRAEEYDDLRRAGYFMNDLVGRSGIESICETRLRGQQGLEVVTRDHRNRAGDTLYDDEARAGQDVVLSLDLALQQRAEAVLDRVLEEVATRAALRGDPPPGGAAAVVLDVRTGDVYCMASSPRFDVNRVAKDYAALVADEGGPLHDRTVAPPRVAPPGSVFKILTAIAGIESGVIDPDRTHLCRGYLFDPRSFRCHQRSGHGNLDLYHSIEQSCDIYFYLEGQAIEDPAERGRPGTMAEWAREFGFGNRTGVEVVRESAGLLPTRAWKLETLGEPWYDGNSRHMAIGQGFLETTPLQVARFMAAVATGRLVRPRLDLARPVESRDLPVSDRSLRVVHEGMRLVVEGGHGTARKVAAFSRLRASAKTGTAEVGGSAGDHAWIAGFLPREAPRLAFAVLVENAGHGGEVAGPVAGEILEAAVEELGR